MTFDANNSLSSLALIYRNSLCELRIKVIAFIGWYQAILRVFDLKFVLFFYR
jgi:hypothetical protein